jgi:hypothetical protein
MTYALPMTYIVSRIDFGRTTYFYMNFKEWLFSEGTNPGAKTGLYPLGYAGIGLYPPQWYLTRSADAIFYMSIDERIYSAKDHKLKELPGSVPKKMNSGDRGTWNISHLGGKPSHSVGNDYACKNGESGIWDITHLSGGKANPAANKDYAASVGDGKPWNIKHLKSQ